MKIKIKIAILFVTVLAVILSASCKKSGGTAAAAGPEKREPGQLEKTKPAAEKTLYQCPMHPTYVSDKPGDCPICGMKLVPVEPQEKPAKAEESPAPKKKVMYRSTMTPNEVSDKPGKDSMGMDMVPFEVEERGAVTEVGGRIQVKISPERQQLIGIKTAPVRSQPIHKLIKAVGRVDYAEPNLSIVNLKFDGWVEKLFVNSTGRAVRKGEPLFDIYSPDLLAAQQEYLIALKAGAVLGDASTILKSAREKLRLWDIPDREVEELGRTGQTKKTVTIHSPGSGIVIEKSVLQGQKIMSGENLFKIADLSRVWILGEIYEYELPFIKTGQEAKISLSSYPGESFAGRITYIYPYLKPETRTNQVRIEADNPGLKLKPEMFANLEIHVDYGTKLTVPSDAVLDAGGIKIVFVSKGDGYFEPREVKLGVRGNDMYEVLGGVSNGENVVTSANFLIDSESSLKAALSRMTKASPGEHKHD
ncbi:MAG: efflux RND transporter periplasmic adaptor subunit [Candidatus Aminicenantes bacterium]|nr:efflux RND transporter periplasmic adaptor subunit [Candidatus Aminicenantes bacterium]